MSCDIKKKIGIDASLVWSDVETHDANGVTSPTSRALCGK